MSGLIALSAVAFAAEIPIADHKLDLSVVGHINGQIAGGYTNKDGGSVYGPGIENKDQADADLLQIKIAADDVSGFEFRVKVGGTFTDQSDKIAIRGLKGWIKPVSWLTLSAGDVGIGLF